MTDEEIQAIINERDALRKEKEERASLESKLTELETRLTEKFTEGTKLPDTPENSDPLEALIKNIFKEKK